ncbi:hypothetical protein FLP10_06080 [Agromyces intestinalis]|uniref:Rhodanese domain-containing protein n=1 Tax=Agromyces intestinalis TaxID=2592652 RepID=A0A5C1YLP1_9MICO|nr:hypothetical protein FLP10_06080 [Agromyces intestinalis]
MIAANDNARWCAAVARAHGIAAASTPWGWRARAAMPEGYPEAVTLGPGAAAAEVAAAVPPGPASVKDSFADLDLHDAGFEVLLEGGWIALEREGGGELSGASGASGASLAGAGAPPLEPVRTARALADWALASGAVAAGHPALLDDPAVVVLAASDESGAVVAGGILSLGDDAVGVSNVFGRPGTYAAIATAATVRAEGRPVVGWEPADLLASPAAAGFVVVGPMRVWVR